MKKELAERLMAKIMEWSDDEIGAERLRLETLSKCKYDEYQQFSPGRRFLESFAIWLSQFSTLEERKVAYKFITDRIIFITSDEMNLLVNLVFPTIIRKKLLEDSAQYAENPSNQKEVLESLAYRKLRRRTLFLGLSDGANTGQFRRSNPMISHEQVYHAYDLSEEKTKDIQNELSKNIENIAKTESQSFTEGDDKFEYVVLIDDFSGSGKSFIRQDENGKIKGKIAKIIYNLKKGYLSNVVVKKGLKVLIVLLVASNQAKNHIEENLPHLVKNELTIDLHIIQLLDDATVLNENSESELFKLIDNPKYFNIEANDEHSKIGNASIKYGFSGCRLPVVLSHNTPNNSIYLLWAEDYQSQGDQNNFRGLFPRISRHRTTDQT